MIYLILMIILALAVAPYSLAKAKNRAIRHVDKLIENFIEKNNFTVTKAINIPGYNNRGYFFIDDNKKCINYLFWEKSNSSNLYHRTFSYKDILKCELIKNKKIEDLKNKNQCIDIIKGETFLKNLGIRVILNQSSSPYLDIMFLNSAVDMEVADLDITINSLNEWLNILNNIINIEPR